MILDTDALLINWIKNKQIFFSWKTNFFFFKFSFFQQHKKKDRNWERNLERRGKKTSENSFNYFFVKLH